MAKNNYGNKNNFALYVLYQGGPTLMKPKLNLRVGRKR